MLFFLDIQKFYILQIVYRIYNDLSICANVSAQVGGGVCCLYDSWVSQSVDRQSGRSQPVKSERANR